jgi:hypothetical protein
MAAVRITIREVPIMARIAQVTATFALAMALAFSLVTMLHGSAGAQGKSKSPSVLVEEHKEACMDAGGSSFDSVSINGYTMSRCTFDGGTEEICDHSSGQTECDTWQPHTRQVGSVLLFHNLVKVDFGR